MNFEDLEKLHTEIMRRLHQVHDESDYYSELYEAANMNGKKSIRPYIEDLREEIVELVDRIELWEVEIKALNEDMENPIDLDFLDEDDDLDF